MIELAPNTLFLLYLAFTLACLLGVWAGYHFRSSKRRLSLLEHRILVCEYCQNVYLEDLSKDITQCPLCKNYNRDNVFKKGKIQNSKGKRQKGKNGFRKNAEFAEVKRSSQSFGSDFLVWKRK